MSAFGIADISYYVDTGKRLQTCNVRGYTTRFKLRLNGQSYVECRSMYIIPGRLTP